MSDRLWRASGHRQLPLNLSICPICGAEMQPNQIAASVTYLGHTHVFCSVQCQQRFQRKPELHLADLAHADESHLGYPCPQRTE
jgi:YHS domain-containing protein